MADNTQNTLAAAIKALEQVIAPAVNTTDPLASEQLRLVIGTLKVLGSRLDHIVGRQDFELRHYLQLGQALQSDAREVSAEIAQRLDAAIEHALQMQAQPQRSPAQTRQATEALASPVSALARQAPAVTEATRLRIERCIVKAQGQWVDMQRAWFLTHGFELRPTELQSLDTLLHATVPPSPTQPKETT